MNLPTWAMTVRQRAAVMTGLATYTDADGKALRDVEVSDSYYYSNHGETFPRWVDDRVKSGEMTVGVRA